MILALKEVDLSEPPCCPTCGKEIEFTTKTKADLKTSVGGWKTYCSRKCSKKWETRALNKFKDALAHLGLESPPVCIQCGKDVEFTSQYHVTNEERKTPFGGWRDFCSSECSLGSKKTVEKRKETMIKNTGYASYMQNPENRSKASVQWTEEKKKEYNKKRIETSLEKYGVDHFSKTSRYIQNRNETNIARYGVDNTFKNRGLVESGVLKKYGVPVAIQSKEVLEKKNKTMVERYGNENPMKNKSIVFKSRISTIGNLPEILRPIKENIFVGDFNKAKEEFTSIIQSIGTEPTRHQLTEKLGISYSHTNWLVRYFDLYSMFSYSTGTSKAEQDVREFVESLICRDCPPDRTILSGREIDIFDQSTKIGIEFNGSFYHSENFGGKDKSYHVKKHQDFFSCGGSSLFFIYDFEWEDHRQDIWKSILTHAFGKTPRTIYARGCRINDISAPVLNSFLIENHLQGVCYGSSIRKGLFFGEELVGVISIGKSRFSKKYDYEVQRVSLKKYTNIPGGSSRLIKAALAEIRGTVVCYQEKRIGGNQSSVYSNIFDSVSETGPGWFGYDMKKNESRNRMSLMKHRLPEGFDLTENKICKIWDCGNYVFVRK